LLDVIVIGAGPGGNNAAGQLAATGYDVAVVERKERIGDKLCTGIVGAECFRRFPAPPETVLREATSAIFTSPSGVEVSLQKDTPQAYVLDRVCYVDSFARRAAASGARYIRSHVLNLEVKPDRVVATIEKYGDIRVLEAKAAIIANGFGSKFPHMLGMGSLSEYATGAQAEVETPHQDIVRIFFGHDFAPDFFAWLVPTRPGRALAGLISRRNAREHLKGFIANLQSQNRVLGITKDSSQWGIPLGALAQTYRDRVLVVGDAAGQVKPTTGGGIYYALLAGDAAAETLHTALSQNDFSASHLSSYEKAWKSIMLRDIKVGRSARRIFESLKDWQIDSLMKTIATNGIRHDVLNSKNFSFDWHSNAIVTALGHPLLSGALRVVSPLATRMAARLITR
jgi:digeranylgeranylglycerophospholipid reductase